VNARFQVLKTDPKHTTQQWPVIISSRPPPHSRAGGRADDRQLPPWGYKIRTLRQVRADKIEADDLRVCGTDESI